MRNHFKRGCGCEGLLTNGTEADGIVVLLSSNKATHSPKTPYKYKIIRARLNLLLISGFQRSHNLVYMKD